MNEKQMKIVASVISGILNPFLMPFLGFVILFLFSFLSLMPLEFKLIVLGIVYCFTILTPMLGIFLFKKLNGLQITDFGVRKNRLVTYLLTITPYLFCLTMMHRIGLPHFMNGIIHATLLAMIINALLNLKWKTSEHMTGIGGVTGGLIAFGFLFQYNPIWWLCLAILASGVLGSSLIILNKHTLGQVTAGYLIGLTSTIYCILYS